MTPLNVSHHPGVSSFDSFFSAIKQQNIGKRKEREGTHSQSNDYSSEI